MVKKNARHDFPGDAVRLDRNRTDSNGTPAELNRFPCLNINSERYSISSYKINEINECNYQFIVQ